MREIIFRGKEKPGVEWAEGYMQILPSGKVHIVYTDKEFCPSVMHSRYVDPESVCQYTGWTNKNGRIYEKDIFQASDGEYIQRYIITWNEYSLEWSAECIGNPDGTLSLSEFRADEIEVIGNIFDNPELTIGNEEERNVKTGTALRS